MMDAGDETSGCVAMGYAGDNDPGWLARFHAGHRATLADFYREHFDDVMRAVGGVLSGADQETVVQDVFYRLVSEPELRQGFRGGVLAAWLTTIARRRAIDYVRRRSRESTVEPGVAEDLAGSVPEHVEASATLRELVGRFEREQVPDAWRPVFRARFIEQKSQREAARALGMRRTTLAYQEARLRRRLRRFVLRMEEP